MAQAQRAKTRQSANPMDQATLTVNEKILRECHVLYTDPDKGLIKIAEHFGLRLLAPRKKIIVLLIGNHSAGKSSFINWYIEEHVQKTGVAIETQGFVIVTSGKKRESLMGNATLHLYPHFKPLQKLPVERCFDRIWSKSRGSILPDNNPVNLTVYIYTGFKRGQKASNMIGRRIDPNSLPEFYTTTVYNSGVIDFLSTEISTSKQKKFSLVTFVDTPGLVDGDMQYPYDVNETIMWLGKMADLVFVFFDPIGQALCKRTLDLVERLNTSHTEKMRFYLSKADDAGNESDRQRVLMQIVQELCKRPGLNRTGFDMPTIYIPDLNKQTRCVNQIDGMCETVEHTINQTIQNTLNTLERDCESVSQLITRRVIQDVADRNYNFKTSGRAMFLGGLGAVIPFLLVTYLLVTNLSNSFLDSILGERTTDSLIAFLSPVGMVWSIIPKNHQWTFVLFMVVVSAILFTLTKWSLGLRDTLSRKQKRSFETMIDHIENVVKIRKQQLYREYLEQSVGDHDL